MYKKLVVKNDTLVGAVLYGDTADGAWYFQLVKDGQNIHEIRDHLMFGQNHVGDVGHAGKTLAQVRELIDMYESPKDAVAQAKRFLSVLTQHRATLEQLLTERRGRRADQHADEGEGTA